MIRGYLRNKEQPALVAGDERTCALAQSHVMYDLFLTWADVVTVTGGSGAGAPVSDGVERVLDRLTILDGETPEQNVPGRLIPVMNQYMEPGPSSGDSFTDPADDTAGDKPIAADLRFALYLQGVANFGTFLFAPYARSRPRFGVKLASLDELFSSAADYTSLALKSGSQDVDLHFRPAENVPKQGPDRLASSVYGYLSRKTYTQAITGADDNFNIELDIKPGWHIGRVWLIAENNGSSGKRYSASDAIVNTVKWTVNGVVRVDTITWSRLQRINKDAYGLSAAASGYAVLDACEDGNAIPNDLWLVQDGDKPTLTLDVDAPTGQGRVTVMVEAVKFPHAPRAPR